eukprot:TRINITY_DN4125_c0_g1_i2.p1 TRINITY_DN4125_c0_g1~~TRINITY_DN4125_c0_g1_i2.p1  ORF type:complete len:218 (+),score=37.11 TRINITY_DN4125_c0_g1_i2:704-1357(+)
METSKAYSSCIMYNDKGIPVGRYDKIHLFDVVVSENEKYLESSTSIPGSTSDKNIVVVDSPVGKLGLSVCYDIRFPELYRKQRRLGANVLLIPSAFTQKTGEAHWLTLCKARAIENQCYVVAAAQHGLHNIGRRTYGHTLIIDPWGQEVAILNENKQQSNTTTATTSGILLLDRDDGTEVENEAIEGVVYSKINHEYINQVRKQMPIEDHRKIWNIQ